MGLLPPEGGAPALLFLVPDALEALGGAAGAEPGIDEGVKDAIHHGLDVAGFNAGPQVFDHAVGLEDVTANLVAQEILPFSP